MARQARKALQLLLKAYGKPWPELEDREAVGGFQLVMGELLRFLESRVIVAHHARFDLSFLRAAVHRAGLRAPENPVLCTVRLSRRLFPELARHDLESLCRHHGIPGAGNHT